MSLTRRRNLKFSELKNHRFFISTFFVRKFILLAAKYFFFQSTNLIFSNSDERDLGNGYLYIKYAQRQQQPKKTFFH